MNKYPSIRMEQVNTQYKRYRIPGLIATAPKTLICCYECRKEGSDWAQIDIKLQRSTDGGKTWQTIQMIPGNGDTLNNPVLIADGNTIHLLYCRNYKQLYHQFSTDHGEHFSLPEEISYVFENSGVSYTVAAVGPGHGIVQKGRLVVPVWLACNEADPKAHRPSVIATIYSEDHGRTWQFGAQLGAKLVNPSECALAVTPDGKILNSIRNENAEHLRYLAISPDGFSQWQELGFCENLPDPICQGSMTNGNGCIYHLNCANPNARKELTLKISSNHFDTFSSVAVDTEGGYGDLAIDGEDICVLYERNVKEDGLYFVRFPLP